MSSPLNLYNQILIELPYLGNVQFYSKCCLGLPVSIEQHEHYNKGSFRNRCVIASSNGPLRLSVPLQRGKNESQSIRDVKISYRENWPIQHWRSLSTAYGKSPFFEYYAADFDLILRKMHTFLFDLNWELHEKLMNLLGLDNLVTRSESFEENPLDTLDLRDTIRPKSDPKDDLWFNPQPYGQVFEDRLGFLENLSVIDLLFCYGPGSLSILNQSVIQST